MLQYLLGCLYLFELVFLFPLNKYSGLKLLDYMVVLFLIFWGTCILFSIVTGPIYISTKNTWRSPSLYIFCWHLLCVVLRIVAILTSVRCHSFMILIFTSLMISDAEHSFMCLFSICPSSLGKVYSGALPIFKLFLFYVEFYVEFYVYCIF